VARATAPWWLSAASRTEQRYRRASRQATTAGGYRPQISRMSRSSRRGTSSGTSRSNCALPTTPLPIAGVATAFSTLMSHTDAGDPSAATLEVAGERNQRPATRFGSNVESSKRRASRLPQVCCRPQIGQRNWPPVSGRRRKLTRSVSIPVKDSCPVCGHLIITIGITYPCITAPYGN
jgi:hypothetical protein